MKADVLTLDAEKAGSVDLDEAIFSLPPRPDILHRVVTWQQAKRRAGTHKVKGRGEINATGTKMYRQKGTGRARHGARKVTIFRGGGRSFGPAPRDHRHKLPKKIRKLGLKTALSAKCADGHLLILDELKLEEGKTKALKTKLDKLGLKNALFIDGGEVDANVRRAVANIPEVDVLPGQGANVYDILRRNTLVVTRAGLETLTERLK